MESFVNYAMSNSLRLVAFFFVVFLVIIMVIVSLVFRYKKKQSGGIDSYTIFQRDQKINCCREKSCDTGKVNHKIFNNDSIDDIIKDGAKSLCDSTFDFRGVDIDTK